ncbi:MAG: hypothetical protein UU84_C0023G0001, partial [Candidatus Yanofskybacteria bacterium GW2011_GWC2_41_9]
EYSDIKKRSLARTLLLFACSQAIEPLQGVDMLTIRGV